MTANEPEPPFAPISPNPYIVGNPVRDRSMFFGREAEFEMVRNRFQESERGGGLLVFCGERRSGKTSILFQILDKRLGPKFIPVLIDMQSMAIANEADFLGKIAQEVLDALGERAEGIPLPEFGGGTNHADVFRRFIEDMLRRCPDRKLILLFDEYELFENKIDAGILSRDVLSILHNLMENRSVFLVFTGSQHLQERRRDYWRILGASTWKQISYLEPSDARKLICTPVEGRVRFGEGTVDAIYRLSAGQPFYTQAICQSLIDQLNERKSREVTLELLGEVVRGIVSNPLPQMIFLWDSLERDEKLTLALLAEALADDRALSSDAALAKRIRTRKYPLEMDLGRIAAALESLFRAELLGKDDSVQPPTYAFRMDLWRLWIRRMHSVWQVMREQGLNIRPPMRLRIGPISISMLQATTVFVLLGVVGAGTMWRFIGPASRSGPGGAAGSTGAPGLGIVDVEAAPPYARIDLDGQQVATGKLRTGQLPGNHVLRFTAPGYGETTLTVRLVTHRKGPNGAEFVDNFRSRVALRALFADLRVVTSPPGAQINLDGAAQGASPLTLRGLGLAGSHDIEARLPGRETAKQTVQLRRAGEVESVSLVLPVSKAVLVLTSDPPGATLAVDGVTRGTAMLQLAGIPYGAHRILARLEGYAQADTSVDVSGVTTTVHFALVREPGGELVINGDRSAEFWVDGRQVGKDVPNSRPVPVVAGSHQITVILGSGAQIDTTLVVKSRERVSYDFSSNRVTRTLVGTKP